MTKLLARHKRDENGVIAVIVALLAMVLLMFAAYAIDIGMQVNRKHLLNDTLDSAAQAGAFELPGSSVTAKAKALAFAVAHDPTATGTTTPNVDFWCVVASKLGQPDTTQIPSTCYPGTGAYTANATYKATGLKVACGPVICAIPCVEPTPNNGTPKIACNTIRVFQGRVVPFGFAPAGGIQQGSTGNVVSVACKGPCGTVAPNPMDVAIVADRTGSMDSADLIAMRDGIRGMLQVMTPSQQYVALGTIGRTTVSTTPTSEPGGACAPASSSATTGAWLPVPFSNNYLTGAAVNNNSALAKGVNCLTNTSSTGTSLAAPMKAAARYLLGTFSGTPNNLGTGTLVARTPAPTKVLIFETDGEPNESADTGGSTSLSMNNDIFSKNTDYLDSAGVVDSSPTVTGPVDTTGTHNTTGPNQTWTDTYKTTTRTTYTTKTRTLIGGQGACANLSAVATNAKNAVPPIKVITIAYNLGGNVTCGDSNVAGSLPATTHGTSSAPVINSITPVAAQTTNPTTGVKTLKTTYKGAAVINQTVTRTGARTLFGTNTDSLVRNTLAAAASPSSTGAPSAANFDCATPAGQASENADGDFFFCAASGTSMASIFTTALAQVSKGIKFIKPW